MPSFLLLLRRSNNFTSNVSIVMHTLGPFPSLNGFFPTPAYINWPLFNFSMHSALGRFLSALSTIIFVNVNVPANQDTQSRLLQMMVWAHSVTIRGGRTLTSPSPAGTGSAHRQEVRMCVPVIKWPLINFRH